jgi:hypothetical protein
LPKKISFHIHTQVCLFLLEETPATGKVQEPLLVMVLVAVVVEEEEEKAEIEMKRGWDKAREWAGGSK